MEIYNFLELQSKNSSYYSNRCAVIVPICKIQPEWEKIPKCNADGEKPLWDSSMEWKEKSRNFSASKHQKIPANPMQWMYLYSKRTLTETPNHEPWWCMQLGLNDQQTPTEYITFVSFFSMLLDFFEPFWCFFLFFSVFLLWFCSIVVCHQFSLDALWWGSSLSFFFFYYCVYLFHVLRASYITYSYFVSFFFFSILA